MCYFLVTTSLKSFSTIAHGSLLKIPDENPRARRPHLETFQTQIPVVVSHDVHRRRSAPDKSLNYMTCYHFFNFYRKGKSVAVKRGRKIFISQSDLISASILMKIKDGADDDVASLFIPGGRTRRSHKIP